MSRQRAPEQGLCGVVAETPLGWCGVLLSPAGIRQSTLFLPRRAAAENWIKREGAGMCADGVPEESEWRGSTMTDDNGHQGDAPSPRPSPFARERGLRRREGGRLSEQVISRLQDYTGGDRTALQDFPVDLEGHTELQRRVWLTLREIPPGETRTYAWLAERVGLGRSGARAVGTINGDNPVPLWLPCHRVIASDGTLGGYAGGLGMKTQLLELEGALPRRMV